MKKEKKDKDFLHKPVYPGGIKAMRQLIRENLQYPEAARAKKIEGTVHIRYDIDHRGVVTDAKIISGLGSGCDEEAVRLVKLFKFQVPKTRKLKVLFHKTMQIHFRLPKVKKVPDIPVDKARPETTATPTINYHYVVRKPKPEKPDEPKKNKGYEYTISW